MFYFNYGQFNISYNKKKLVGNIQGIPWNFTHYDIPWNNKCIINLFFIRLTEIRTKYIYFLNWIKLSSKKVKYIFLFLKHLTISIT